MLGYDPLHWLVLVQTELFLLAGTIFLVGALDELAVDLVWLWGRMTGRITTPIIERGGPPATLDGPVAVFIPAWRERHVIGVTIAHAMAAWPQKDIVFYIGCYRNDPATWAAARRAGGGDRRLRVIVQDVYGPTTKADCLNALYRAMRDDQHGQARATRFVILQDAEDMVDPAALGVMERGLADADFIQIPVVPVCRPGMAWIGGHYADEFVEAHGRVMPVRALLGAALPSAGVGTAIARPMLDRIAATRGDGVPFAAESLTEDYELGFAVRALGGRSRFVRVRGSDGRLVATRAMFPHDIGSAVRQKTRWILGIALQGWDRVGWSRRPVEFWMRLRDRRGPLHAMALALAYLLVVSGGISVGLAWLGLLPDFAAPPALRWVLRLNIVFFVWRAALRCALVTREYGPLAGGRSILRILPANIVAILAARRALWQYFASLRGRRPVWDKTIHRLHAVSLRARTFPQ